MIQGAKIGVLPFILCLVGRSVQAVGQAAKMGGVNLLWGLGRNPHIWDETKGEMVKRWIRLD